MFKGLKMKLDLMFVLKTIFVLFLIGIIIMIILKVVKNEGFDITAPVDTSTTTPAETSTTTTAETSTTTTAETSTTTPVETSTTTPVETSTTTKSITTLGVSPSTLLNISSSITPQQIIEKSVMPTSTSITTPTTTNTNNTTNATSTTTYTQNKISELNYRLPKTNIFQNGIDGATNIYSPYLYLNEPFQPVTYDMDNFTYLE